LVEPSVTQDYLTSALAVGLGAAGIGIAWMLYGSREWAVPRVPALQRTLEHKFWFDELYDAIFHRPAVLASRLLRDGVEKPLIGGSITGVTRGAREAGGAVGEAQTGYLRSYALAIAAAVAVLVVVFITVQ
jgi:NADH-quinone oxidoreductase subunit L